MVHYNFIVDTEITEIALAALAEVEFYSYIYAFIQHFILLICGYNPLRPNCAYMPAFVHICLLLGYVSKAKVHINECIFLNVLLDLVCSAAIWHLGQRVKYTSEHRVVICLDFDSVRCSHADYTISIMLYK